MKLARYFESRMLHGLFLLFSVSILAFSISQLAPGSFLDDLRMNPAVSSQTIESLRVQYGLDQPLTVRYLRWAKSLLHGDLGYSLSYKIKVNQLIWPRVRNTLLLGIAAMLLSWILALPCGLLSARRAGSWIDRWVSWSATALLGTPELALALFFVLLAARFRAPDRTLLSYGQGAVSASDDIVNQILVPCAALALAAFPLLYRHIRAAVLEASDAPCVRAARGHGISDFRLLLRHVLPLASNPLISLVGLSLATVISGSFVVEIITGWPGLGPLFFDAIYSRDAHVMMAIVMLFSLLLIASNFVADLLLYASDPRVRAES